MIYELKPCPFCGGTHIQPAPLSDYEWYRCYDCDALSGKDGAEGWNTRPIEDALRAERDAAVARVAELEARLKSAEHEVHEILLAALSGDNESYLSYDLEGNKYCKWGIVSKDIKAVFGVTEPSDIEC